MKRGGPSWGGARAGGSIGGGPRGGGWGGAQRAPLTAEVKKETEEELSTSTKPVQLSYVSQRARGKEEKSQTAKSSNTKPTKDRPSISSTSERQIFDFGEGARVVYYPAFLDKPLADSLLDEFLKTIPWDARDVYIEGVGWVPQPRLVAWMSSDKTFEYTYNNLTLQPNTPTPALVALQKRIEAVSPGCRYDGTLINLYRNGKDSIAAHSDSEDTLVNGSTIASVSLGCERSFILKPKHEVGPPTEIKVKHGSLILMEGTLQKHFVHEVPKDFKLCLTHYGPDKYGLCDCPHTKRINLTMRHYKPPSSSTNPRTYAIKITD